MEQKKVESDDQSFKVPDENFDTFKVFDTKVESPDVPKESDLQNLIRRCRNHLGDYAIKGVLVREDVNQLTIEAQLIEKELADLRAEKSINNPDHHIKVLKEQIQRMEKEYQELRAELRAERDKLKKRLEISFSYQVEKALNDQLAKQIKENDELKAENERLKEQVINALTANTLIKESFTSELQRRWPSCENIKKAHLEMLPNDFFNWLKSYLENK